MKLKIQMLDDAGVEIFDSTFNVKNTREASRALHTAADACLAVEKNVTKKAQKVAAAAITLALERLPQEDE